MTKIIEESKQQLDPRSNLRGGVLRARKTRLAWLALAAFVLGVSLCPFNPTDSGKNGRESTKEDPAMSSALQSTAAADASRPEERPAAGVETATFAMG
jgi:hypothetical protein